MQVKVEGVKQTRKAIRLFAPDLSKALDKDLRRVLKPLTAKARGFVPSSAPLSGWAKGEWFPYSASSIKSGIGFSTKPGAVSKYGFTSNARIFNNSVAGAIYERAGSVPPGTGRPHAAPSGLVTRTSGSEDYPNADFQINYYAIKSQTGNKKFSQSRNPNAGKQLIDAMNSTGVMKNASGQTGRGRRSRKSKGRLIFRAWAEDQGKVNGAAIKAIDTATREFNKRAETTTFTRGAK